MMEGTLVFCNEEGCYRGYIANTCVCRLLGKQVWNQITKQATQMEVLIQVEHTISQSSFHVKVTCTNFQFERLCIVHEI
jgi:hypothetical protein